MVEPRRGELWTLAGGGGPLTNRPRPVLIISSDVFAASDFVTVMLVTSDQTEGFTRIPVLVNEQTGLKVPSMIEVDKITTVPRRNLGHRCGQVPPTMLAKVREVVTAYLGFGG
ncbi:MAG: type II toxin-antitoxin system PemK/MazF family toxin [Actinomycetia bacterium]|nr:type II toxin-antitoxin system PemK/MazF family toxin [Actinomycetes bacterium]